MIMKRIILAVLALCFFFTACGADKEAYNTVISTDTLLVQQRSTDTIITSKTADKEYKLERHRVLHKKDAPTKSSVLIDDDTIKVEQVKGVLIVTDKVTGTSYFL